MVSHLLPFANIGQLWGYIFQTIGVRVRKAILLSVNEEPIAYDVYRYEML